MQCKNKKRPYMKALLLYAQDVELRLKGSVLAFIITNVPTVTLGFKL